jgi:hypothetical protein
MSRSCPSNKDMATRTKPTRASDLCPLKTIPTVPGIWSVVIDNDYRSEEGLFYYFKAEQAV